MSLSSQQLWRSKLRLGDPRFQPGVLAAVSLQALLSHGTAVASPLNVCKGFNKSRAAVTRWAVGQQQLQYLGAAVTFDGAGTLPRECCQMALHPCFRALCR